MHVSRDSYGLINYWKVRTVRHGLSRRVFVRLEGILSSVKNCSISDEKCSH